MSEHLRTIGKLKLSILNWYDLIITKIARSEERDIVDILAILKSQELDFNQLKERYYSHAEISLITDYDIKFKYLEQQYKQK